MLVCNNKRWPTCIFQFAICLKSNILIIYYQLVLLFKLKFCPKSPIFRGDLISSGRNALTLAHFIIPKEASQWTSQWMIKMNLCI